MKILVLGAGNAQIDAIKYCRDSGFEIHACGRSPEDAGIGYVDVFKLLDIRDTDEIERYVESNGIDVLYSVGSDAAMPTISLVSENLGLPCFISSETANICHYKDLMRRTLGFGFKGNVSFKTINTPEDAMSWETFPCVMKPIDSQGQRGVFILRSADDFDKHYQKSVSFSRNRRVILEDYIEGQEISVNAYIVHGDIKFYQTSDRSRFTEYPGGIPKEHRIPSDSIQDEEKICELVTFVAQKIGILDGPAYFQIKLDRDYPKLIEVTPRLDGCHIWRLIRQYVGVDLLDCTFKHLVNQELPSFAKNKCERAHCLRFLCEKPGKKVDKSKFKIKDPVFLEWYYEQGQIVKPINGYIEKIGYYITEG